MRRNALAAISFAAILLAVSNLRADEPKHSAVAPEPRADQWWQDMHHKFNQRAQQGDVELVFLGDSITQGWANNETWKKFYSHRQAANFGIGGDRTQHVLWRIQNGNLEGIAPKVAILMIGTNNASANSAEEIADGIEQIVATLHEKLPDTKILLLGVFPRGESPNPTRDKLAQTNELISTLADGEHVRYLDIGPSFLEEDGTISKEVMPDFLHLSPRGYQIWAESIEPAVAELLGDQVLQPAKS